MTEVIEKQTQALIRKAPEAIKTDATYALVARVSPDPVRPQKPLRSRTKPTENLCEAPLHFTQDRPLTSLRSTRKPVADGDACGRASIRLIKQEPLNRDVIAASVCTFVLHDGRFDSRVKHPVARQEDDFHNDAILDVNLRLNITDNLFTFGSGWYLRLH